MATITTSTDVVAKRRSVSTLLTTRTFDVVRYVVMLILAVLIFVPLVYGVLGGFRTNGDLVGSASIIPSSFVIDNYRDVLTAPTFWRETFNSTLVAAIVVFLAVGCSSLAAFVFARMSFRGREALYTFFAMGLMFPLAVAMLPLFIMIRELGLTANPLGIALPEAAFLLPMTIIILRPFFKSIPNELEDAAKIDGCTTFGFFWRVLMPLAKPALATVAVYAIVMSWNQFFLPLLVLNQDTYTLPLGVMYFQMEHTSDWARILAFTSVAMIPAILFYVAAERQIVSGLTAGSVKG